MTGYIKTVRDLIRLGVAPQKAVLYVVHGFCLTPKETKELTARTIGTGGAA